VKAETKNLDYYLSLNYEIVIRKITKYDKPFFQAYTRELDPVAFYGVGDTVEEAIKSLEETKEELFGDFIEKGFSIPEPEVIDDESYSGKFIVRTSPATHRKLARMAKKNKQSLNSQIKDILNTYLTKDGILEVAKKELKKAIETLFEQRSHKDRVYNLPDDWPVQSEGVEKTGYKKAM